MSPKKKLNNLGAPLTKSTASEHNALTELDVGRGLHSGSMQSWSTNSILRLNRAQRNAQ